MASANTLCKKLLNFKNAVVIGSDFYTDADGANHIRIKACPNKWHENDVPSVISRVCITIPRTALPVVEWAMKTLDEVCREVWREAYSQAVQLAKEHPRRKTAQGRMMRKLQSQRLPRAKRKRARIPHMHLAKLLNT